MPRFFQHAKRSAGGENLDAERRERAGKFDDPGLVGDAEESAFNTHVTGHGSFIMRYPGSSMRLVTFQQPGSVPEAGIVEGNRVQGLGVDMLTVCAAGRVPEARGPPSIWQRSS